MGGERKELAGLEIHTRIELKKFDGDVPPDCEELEAAGYRLLEAIVIEEASRPKGSSMPLTDAEAVAWATGLFEGEGSFTVQSLGVEELRPCVRITSTDLDVLE